MGFDLSVTVETSSLPTFTIRPGDGSPPGLLMRALRPRITVRAGGQVLHQVEPAGPPDQGAPWGLLLVAGAALALVWWKLR